MVGSVEVSFVVVFWLSKAASTCFITLLEKC